MSYRCQIIEKENNCWIIFLAKSIDDYECFGPFCSKYEVDAYINEYLHQQISAKEFYDFEHPQTKFLFNSIKSPPCKDKYWDFEDYKVMAWRNAGFRSRR